MKTPCECENYKCEEFGPESMKTTDKRTGRVVQAAKSVVKNCIRFFNPTKDPRREDEKAWDNSSES